MGTLINWQTWKRKHKPQMMTLQDSSLGYIETIKPTLQHAGFNVTYNSRDDSISPKADALEVLSLVVEDVDSVDAVYWVWRHSRGYCEEINVAWKEIEKPYQGEEDG